MKLKLAIAALLVSTTAVLADGSTVNPGIPAANSSLSSSPIRANFQATYNDINRLFTSPSFATSVTVNANTAVVPTLPSGTVLLLNGADAASAFIQVYSYTFASTLNLSRAQGTGLTPATVTSASNLGLVNFRGYDSSVYASGATLRGVASETWTPTAHGTQFEIFTIPNTTTIGTLALRVNASGGLGIGATAGDPGAGSLVTGIYVATTPTTVGALPSCAAGTKGAHMFVTDSNAASYTAGIGAIVAAGGTTNVPIVCDGTNWRIG